VIADEDEEEEEDEDEDRVDWLDWTETEKRGNTETMNETKGHKEKYCTNLV
jgi:hypothetical protein